MNTRLSDASINSYIITLLNGTGGDSGPCVSAGGATLSIKGHPEIKASYFKDNVTIDPTLTSTASLAITALGPIPPGTYEIDATKLGCTAAPMSNTDFKFPATTTVSAGVITLQLLSLM